LPPPPPPARLGREQPASCCAGLRHASGEARIVLRRLCRYRVRCVRWVNKYNLIYNRHTSVLRGEMRAGKERGERRGPPTRAIFVQGSLWVYARELQDFFLRDDTNPSTLG